MGLLGVSVCVRGVFGRLAIEFFFFSFLVISCLVTVLACLELLETFKNRHYIDRRQCEDDNEIDDKYRYPCLNRDDRFLPILFIILS